MSGPLESVARAFDLVPHAMEGGLAAAAACGGIGALLRWRRLVWAGFAVPEAATAGTSFALGHDTLLPALGIADALPAWLDDVTVWTLVGSAIAVSCLVPVARVAKLGGERGAAACFLLSTTLAVLFVSFSPHGTEEVRSLATGKTLLFLSQGDARTLLLGCPALLLLTFVGAGPLSAIAFDRDHARAAGRRVVAWEAAFALGFLALVAIAAPLAGSPFVFAYLTLPAAAAERDVARPLAVVALAAALGGAGFLAGAAASVAWDLPFATAAVGGVVGADAAALLVSWTVIRPVARAFGRA